MSYFTEANKSAAFEFSQRQVKIHQFFFSALFCTAYKSIWTCSWKKANIWKIHICNNFKQTDQGWVHLSMGKSACLKLFSIYIWFFLQKKPLPRKLSFWSSLCTEINEIVAKSVNFVEVLLSLSSIFCIIFFVMIWSFAGFDF